MNKNSNKKRLKFLVNLISSRSDKDCVLSHPILGKVIFPYGTIGDIRNPMKSRGGYGLEHIVQSRYEKNHLNKEEIAGLCLAIVETISGGTITELRHTRCIISKNGINVVVVEQWRDKERNWVLTGFPDVDEKMKIKKEAMDTILTVNAKYSYLPDYSSFCNQIGAIISSIVSLRQAINKVN